MLFSENSNAIIFKSLELIPSKYMISIEISFDDHNGYDFSRLTELFYDNIYLQLKSFKQKNREDNMLAYSLVAAGVFLFTIMMLISSYWSSGSYWYEVFIYFFDIVTTVVFGEAAGILFGKNKENRRNIKNFSKRFVEIKFS